MGKAATKQEKIRQAKARASRRKGRALDRAGASVHDRSEWSRTLIRPVEREGRAEGGERALRRRRVSTPE